MIDPIALTTSIVPIVVSGLIALFAYQQFRNTRRTVIVGTFSEIMEYISGPAMISRRRRVLANAPVIGQLGNLPPEIVDDVEEVCGAFDRVGFIIELIDDDRLKEKVLDWIGPRIVGFWDIVRNYVIEQRKSPGRENFGSHFWKLADEQKHRQRYFIYPNPGPT